MADEEEMEEFRNQCLQKLDRQVFELNSERAKQSAIQAVHRVLRGIMLEHGEERVLMILRYPRRVILPKLWKMKEIYLSWE